MPIAGIDYNPWKNYNFHYDYFNLRMDDITGMKYIKGVTAKPNVNPPNPDVEVHGGR